MSNRAVLRFFLLACASALLAGVSFPPYSFGKTIPFIALAPFFYGLFSLPEGKHRYWMVLSVGLFFGMVYHAAVLFWLTPLISYWCFGRIYAEVAGFYLNLLLCLYLGLFTGVSAVLSLWIHSRMSARKPAALSLLTPLLFACAWTSIEYVCHFTFGGLTWTNFGTMFWNDLPFSQVLSFTGLYGLTFMAVFVSASLAFFFSRKDSLKVAWVPAVTALILAGVLYGHGISVMRKDVPAGKDPAAFSIAILHSNQPKISPVRSVAQVYGNMVSKIKGKPDLVVWPESSWSTLNLDTPNAPEKMALLESIVSKTGGYHLINMPTRLGAPGEKGAASYNSTVLVSSGGSVVSKYHKMKPFYFIETSLIHGTEFVTHPVRRDGQQTVMVGSPICWEPAFPAITRGFASKGAEIFSNAHDGLWGVGLENRLFQTLMMNRFRSIENCRTTVIAGNCGYSGVFDQRGRLLLKEPAGTEKVLETDVSPRKDRTPYTRFGDWVVWLSMALSLVGICFLMFSRERS